MNEDKEGYQFDDVDLTSSDTPGDWKEAIPSLISARIAIIQAEFREALVAAISKIVLVVIAVFLMLLCWLLIVGGLIGLIAHTSGWKWYFVTLLAAGVHAVVALIAFNVVKSKRTEQVFPVTRAEFEKDVEWLKELKRR